MALHLKPEPQATAWGEVAKIISSLSSTQSFAEAHPHKHLQQAIYLQMNISIIITVLALNNLSLIYTAGGIKVPLMHTKIFHFEMV